MSLLEEARSQGLTEEEYLRIINLLGREPNSVELSIIAVMWSEHCCYKSSKYYLKSLPTSGSRVVQGPGENAGILELGKGWVVAFKVESHNHPSYIEPTQGAATGVGGILRDIFTMGARPIAILDSLHFGERRHSKMPYLYHGVIGGISSYGNCMGIPNVGGETHFDSSYNGNILVNAMAVGICKKDEIQKGAARGLGNVVVYLGSKTGKDGIHGATMASEEFSQATEEKRPTVQVGDPFTEKLLLEACMEMVQEKLIVGIQDMGAAGLACSTFEMSERGKTGMEIHLDKVPLRQHDLGPYEMFLSESQERMLLVTEERNLPRVLAIAAKWELDAAAIGIVNDTGRVQAFFKGEAAIDLPVSPITNEAPIYQRPFKKPQVAGKIHPKESYWSLPFRETLEKFLSLESNASRRPVYRQYDHTVGTNHAFYPGGDAAVLRVKGEKFGIAVTLDSNHHYCRSNPKLGVQHVLAEAARNISCTGAKPIGVTNCLNFGSPEREEIMGQIIETIEGMKSFCKRFDTPITGGNVSLYNQTGTESIDPTPTIGMVGFLDNYDERVPAFFQNVGDLLFLLSPEINPNVYQSTFAREILEERNLACPPLDLFYEERLQNLLQILSKKSVIQSAHDVSEGGLISTILESCGRDHWKSHGCEIKIPEEYSPLGFLCLEIPGQVLVSVEPQNFKRLEEEAKKQNVFCIPLGKVQESIIMIHEYEVNIEQLRRAPSKLEEI